MSRFLRALWSLFWGLFWIALAIASVLGLYNVFSDDFATRQLAEIAACGEQGAACKLQRLEWSRGPIHHAYTFIDEAQAEIHVSCTREYALFGAQTCAVHGRRPYGGPVVMLHPRPAATAKSKVGTVPRPRTSTAAPPLPSAPSSAGTSSPP